MKSDVIVALDFPDRRSVLDFLNLFDSSDDPELFVKIGMELFYSEGAALVREIATRGHRIFLDLKIHDIPNTARGAMASLSRLPIDMVNVHASGGIDMMKSAREGLTRPDGTCPLLIAVTLLTSINDEKLRDELRIKTDLQSFVLGLASLARQAGMDGVVCSPLESYEIKACSSSHIITVSPGVRFPADATEDQARVVTPERARERLCDFIVVGRPITRAVDPVESLRRFRSAFLKTDQ
ncbi:MAG: orotidine-5'-phosphate decarboxylase [Oscillospiraceae bacterium]|nr:orotidine-5'-phosphate decarboxylase [Oscillospiraceae bacterium]